MCFDKTEKKINFKSKNLIYYLRHTFFQHWCCLSAGCSTKCNIKGEARGSIQFLLSLSCIYSLLFLFELSRTKGWENMDNKKSCYLKAGMHIRFHISFSYSPFIWKMLFLYSAHIESLFMKKNGEPLASQMLHSNNNKSSQKSPMTNDFELSLEGHSVWKLFWRSQTE